MMQIPTTSHIGISSTFLALALSLEIAQWIEYGTAFSRTMGDSTPASVPSGPRAWTESPSTKDRFETSSSLATDPFAYFCFSRAAFDDPLSVLSCTDAVRQLDIRSASPTLWGPRNTSHHYQVYLPQRFISSDGSCFIEPLFRAGHESSLTSQQSMATAGMVLQVWY